MAITIQKQEGGYPLYHRYPRQYEAQGAYIELDCQEKMISADWNAEIGNGAPFSVYHGLVHRFSVPACLSADQVNDLMEEIEPWAEEVLQGFEEYWDGHNWVGRFTDEAQEALERIENMCHEVNCCDVLVVTHWSDWFQDSSEIIAALEWGNTFDEMEKEAKEDVEADGHIFDIMTEDFRGYVIAKVVDAIGEFTLLSEVEKAVDEWAAEVTEEEEIREALRNAVERYVDGNLK